MKLMGSLTIILKAIVIYELLLADCCRKSLREANQRAMFTAPLGKVLKGELTHNKRQRLLLFL